MRKFLAIWCAACAATVFGYQVEKHTNVVERDNVTYVQRGGLGNADYVATNVALSGQSRFLPKYLHLMETDDVFPADAAWFYDNYPPTDWACSARRVGRFLERNYDWVYDRTAEYVVRTSAAADRFASVGLANVGEFITEEIATSGKWTRYFKCLAGRMMDGINENGVCCEINVDQLPPDGLPTAWHGSAVHCLAAVRWVLDHGTNAQQAAEYLADNVYVPARLGRNYHYMVADKTSTYIVENGAAHQVEGVAVMTNYRLYPTPDSSGEGQERAAILRDTAKAITNAWWTLAYDRNVRPVRVSDIGTETNTVWDAWDVGDRESHRGQTFGTKSWWQTVHTAIYDLENLTVRVCVQERDDWYTFGIGGSGRVKSVNGKVGEVELNYWDVGALPDNKMLLIDNSNFRDAVEAVSPPVELPAKWALANVTNKNGQAVGPDDVGAYPANRSRFGGEYNSTWPLFVQKTLNGLNYSSGLNLGVNVATYTADGSTFDTMNICPNRFLRQDGLTRTPYNIYFPTNEGTLARMEDLDAIRRDVIVSTNMVLPKAGQVGRMELAADLSITERPDPAYWVHENPYPYVPNVITGRTTRAITELITYEYDGFDGTRHSWTSRAPASEWTDSRYGYACPSNISVSSQGVWYLRNGYGQELTMPIADYPTKKVMTAQVPLTASYRIGSRTMQWVAAPQTWTAIGYDDYDDDYPHFETNYYPVVRTSALRRDDISDWALAPTKPSYTAFEIGTIPFSRYLTTSTYLADFDKIDQFGLGSVYYNASLEMEQSGSAYENFFSITRQGGMAPDFMPLITNTQYRAEGIRHRCYRTSFGTQGTFDHFLGFPHEDGTLATREWVGENAAPANYETVSNRAMNAIQYGEIEPPADYANVSNRAMSAVQPNDAVSTLANDVGYLTTNDVDAVNVVAEYWDETLKANWKVYIDNEDMKFSVSTNVDNTALIQANAVLKDLTTSDKFRVVIEAAEMKFFTK